MRRGGAHAVHIFPLGVLLQTDGSVRDQSVRHHLQVCASSAGVDVHDEALAELAQRMDLRHRLDDRMPVSYTHLTLPTTFGV